MEINISTTVYWEDFTSVLTKCNNQKELKEISDKNTLYDKILESFIKSDEILSYDEVSEKIEETAENLGLKLDSDEIQNCYNRANSVAKYGLQKGTMEFYNFNMEYRFVEIAQIEIEATVDIDLEYIIQEEYDKNHNIELEQ